MGGAFQVRTTGLRGRRRNGRGEFGAEGELAQDGTVHSVSVAPRPYQDPYPELWQPFAISDRSIVRCAQENILPWLFTPDPVEHKKKAESFMTESAKSGYDYALGEHTGILKLVAMGADRADAMEKFKPYVTGDFAAFNGPFGYLEVLRRPTWTIPTSRFSPPPICWSDGLMYNSPWSAERTTSKGQSIRC